MPKVGDRVVVEGSKVGGGRREGTLRKVVGSLIQVQWEDGSETLFAPGAGTVQFLPAGKTNGSSKASKPAAAKKGKDASKGASKAPARAAEKSLAKKTTAKKADAKKAGAKKPAKKAKKK